jgi:hypothetical protein
MILRTFLLSFVLLYCITAHAQDKIYKRDGGIIDAKVKTVGSDNIIYKRFDNQGGPEYSIPKADITKIIYQNGTVDAFDESNKKEYRHAGKAGSASKKSGDNIISVIPLAYTADPDGTMNDPSIGICYERQLDMYGHISVVLPVMINFTSGRDFTNNIYGTGYSGAPDAKGYTSLSFMPGIKFYPTRNTNPIRYGLGATFFTMFGKEPYYSYDQGYNYSTSTADIKYAVYGLMISNSVNISATKHIYLAIDLNTGIPISDNRHQQGEDLGIPLLPIMQFIFKVGYRF